MAIEDAPIDEEVSIVNGIPVSFVVLLILISIVFLPVLGILHLHFLGADVHGHIRVLLAYSQTALGRVPEQVLQGIWLQVHSFLFQDRVGGGNEEKMIAGFKYKVTVTALYSIFKFELLL